MTSDNEIIDPEIQTQEEMIESNTLSEFIQFLRDIVVILLIVLFIRWIIITPFKIKGDSMQTSYHDNEYILVDKFSYFDMRYIFYHPTSTNKIDLAIGEFFDATLAKIPLGFAWPKRGDVIVLTPHVDKNREYYIKRIIGMPGDRIRIENGLVYIQKRSLTEPNTNAFIAIHEPYLSPTNSGQTYFPPYVEKDTFVVPEEMYWVMWDNRVNSADSRSCFRTCTSEIDENAHFVKRSDVLGKVLLSFGYFNIFKDNPDSVIPSFGTFSWVYTPRLFDHPKSAEYPELD